MHLLDWMTHISMTTRRTPDHINLLTGFMSSVGEKNISQSKLTQLVLNCEKQFNAVTQCSYSQPCTMQLSVFQHGGNMFFLGIDFLATVDFHKFHMDLIVLNWLPLI